MSASVINIEKPKTTRKRSNFGEHNGIGYLFISPWLIAFFLFTLIPIVASLVLSFTDFNVLNPAKAQFVGFDNFVRMFMEDKQYARAVSATVKYVIFAVPLRLIFALGVAMLLNTKRRGVSFYRAAFYAPSVVGGSIAVAVMWRQLFGNDGLINFVLALLGVKGPNWLGQPDTAIWTLIILAAWQFGSPMLIFLAGLKNIPEQLYESASIDGATSWKQFTHITLPMLTPIIFFNLIMQIIAGFMVFTQAFIITGGRPLGTTLFYALYVYQRAFENNEMGYASAMAWVLLLVIAVMTALVFRSSSYWVYYEADEGNEVMATVEAQQTTSASAPIQNRIHPQVAWHQGKITRNLLYHVGVGIFAILMLYPILWLFGSSLKAPDEIWTNQTAIIPNNVYIQNYPKGWAGFGGIAFDTFYANSFFYATLGTLISVSMSAVVAYGFSRVKFRGKRIWFSAMLLTLMLPAQVQIIPQYIVFSRLGWLNTWFPLLLPRIGGQAFFIFMIMQFIRGIPTDLDEAAMIDGSSKAQIFFQIILPQLKPALITAAIFSFYWTWDEFLIPLIYLTKPNLYTVSLALRTFADPSGLTDWGAIFAMSGMSLIPVFIIFIVFQRYLVEGIATTGLKG